MVSLTYFLLVFFSSVILTCSSKSYFLKKPHNYNSSLTTHPSLATPVFQSSLYCLHFLSTHLPTPKTPIKAGFNHYMKPMQSNLIPLQQSALLTIPFLSLSFFGFRDNCWGFPITSLVNPLFSSKVLFIYQSFKHCYALKILSLAFSSLLTLSMQPLESLSILMAPNPTPTVTSTYVSIPSFMLKFHTKPLLPTKNLLLILNIWYVLKQLLFYFFHLLSLL